MLRHAISHSRLMRESTDRVQAALQSDNSDEQMVARRILENSAVWTQWESEHSGLMRQLASCGLRHTQVAALKDTSFRLLHGTALFNYLRHGEVRGPQRAQVMAHFRPGRHYEHAIIAEHSLYLRKACSYLCASHVGSEVIEDPMFLDPMQRYEELYAEYFNVYCGTLVNSPNADAAAQRALLPLLKKQLNEYRVAIIDPRRAQPFLRREAELRRATGDTQRMKTLGSRPKKRK